MPRTPPDPIAESLHELGVDAEMGEALHAQVARALEGGTRTAKRKGGNLTRARNLATQPPASGLEPLALVPFVFAVRDVLKRGERGGRTSRARQERLDRAADAAVCGLARAGGATPVHGRRAGGRDVRTAHEMLERLVAVTPDAVFTLRASGAIGMWSVAASRLTGRRRWEVHRRGAGSIFRDRALLDTVLAELDARGRVSGREAQLLGPGGDGVSVRIFGARLKDDPAPPTGQGKSGRDPERYLVVLHDLSEVQHIRQRLIETEKLSAMAKIAGSVAHEFRNPLNSLFLSTDLLEDELEGHETVQASIAPTLAAIREEIERLNQIITHYLSLSRVAGAEPEDVDLRDVVTSFAADSGPRLAESGVELRVRSDEGDCRITADPNQLRRILVNLVENAVDALAAEREADETPRRARRAAVTLLLRRMRRSVKLTVKDNGPGIPDDIRDRVLEPFFTSKAGGAGLGLYLVREIALASGGTMSLSSREGRGTSVSIRWPYAQGEGD
ncbi:MAG: PAS domain-containing sensor histidine kinase [Planctomycetota bacterium]|nr:PAS domain-containing sensor histidine kinase [Planctomycetota bacterium]